MFATPRRASPPRPEVCFSLLEAEKKRHLLHRSERRSVEITGDGVVLDLIAIGGTPSGSTWTPRRQALASPTRRKIA
jgi:hypothetical protein